MNPLTIEQVSEMQLRIAPEGILTGLQPEQLTELEKIGLYMEYNRETVTSDGHMQGYLFYIIQGDFEVSKIDPSTQKKVLLAHIGHGQCFGEMSYLTGAPASANVIALDRAICWTAPHESMKHFIETHECGPHLAKQIASLLGKRVHEANSRLMDVNRTPPPEPQTVKIPQNRPQIVPRPTYHEPPPPNPLWKWVRIAIASLIFFALYFSFLYLTPLKVRESIANSEVFKDLPIQGLLRFVLYYGSTQSNPVTLEEGASYSMDVATPKPLALDVSLDSIKELPATETILVKLIDMAKPDSPLIEQKVVITPGITHIKVLSDHLPPGSYKLAVHFDNAPPGEVGQGTLNVAYFH